MAMNPYEMLLMQRPFSAGMANPYAGALGSLMGAIEGFQRDYPGIGEVRRSPLLGAQNLYQAPFYGGMGGIDRGSSAPSQASERPPSGFMSSRTDDPYRRSLPPQLRSFAGLER